MKSKWVCVPLLLAVMIPMRACGETNPRIDSFKLEWKGNSQILGLVATVRVENTEKLSDNPVIYYAVPDVLTGLLDGNQPLNSIKKTKKDIPTDIPPGLIYEGRKYYYYAGYMSNVSGSKDTFKTVLALYNPPIDKQAFYKSSITVTIVVSDSDGETDRVSQSITPEDFRSTPTSVVRRSTPTSVVRRSTPTTVVRQATPTTVVRQATPTTVVRQATPTTVIPPTPTKMEPPTQVPTITLTPSQEAGNIYIVEEFNDPSMFTQISDDISVTGGFAEWHVSRSAGQQFVYRSIPTFSGDVRLTVRGQVNDWTNNCFVRAGISNRLTKPGENPVGITIDFGFIGGGCGPISPSTPPGPSIMASGVSLDMFETPACSYHGNWLRINPGIPYTAILTISQGIATLTVPGVGTSTGTQVYNGDYSILYVGNADNSDWPECSGNIDSMIIESLNSTP